MNIIVQNNKSFISIERIKEIIEDIRNENCFDKNKQPIGDFPFRDNAEWNDCLNTILKRLNNEYD